MRETGFYQAAPRTGALEGGHSTFGFRGGAFTLPKVRLELPTIELPSFFRTSYAAKMRVAESEAPWTSTGFERVTFAQEAAQGRGAETEPAARETPQPRSAPPDDCEDLKKQYETKIEELNRKISACEEMRQRIEQSLQCQQTLLPGAQCAPAPHIPAAHCPLPAAAVPQGNLPHGTIPAAPAVGQGPAVPPSQPAPPTPQPQRPEEVPAAPADPADGAAAVWRAPDAARHGRAAAHPRPRQQVLPAPVTPRADDAMDPSATAPWQPLPQPTTTWMPPDDDRSRTATIASRPQAKPKPQRLPRR